MDLNRRKVVAVQKAVDSALIAERDVSGVCTLVERVLNFGDCEEIERIKSISSIEEIIQETSCHETSSGARFYAEHRWEELALAAAKRAFSWEDLLNVLPMTPPNSVSRCCVIEKLYELA